MDGWYLERSLDTGNVQDGVENKRPRVGRRTLGASLDVGLAGEVTRDKGDSAMGTERDVSMTWRPCAGRGSVCVHMNGEG